MDYTLLADHELQIALLGFVREGSETALDEPQRYVDGERNPAYARMRERRWTIERFRTELRRRAGAR